MWRTLLELYAIEPWTADEIENFVLEAYLVHEEVVSEASGTTFPVQFARVRYEDVVADPVRQLERIYTQFEMGDFDTVRAEVEKYKEKVASHKRNRFVISRAQKQRIDEKWGQLIRSKGYDWPEKYLQLEN